MDSGGAHDEEEGDHEAGDCRGGKGADDIGEGLGFDFESVAVEGARCKATKAKSKSSILS